MFEYFRCVGLKFKIHPPTSSSDNNGYAIGYLPGTSNVVPSTFEHILEEQNAFMKTVTETNCSYYTIPRRQLVGTGQFKWWRNSGDGIDNNLSIQGTLYYCPAQTNQATMFMEVTSEWEFCGPSVFAFDSVAVSKEQKDEKEQEPGFDLVPKLDHKLSRSPSVRR
jgi:hypothetical protein